MELAALLEGLEFTCVRGNPEISVSGIVYDSRKVKKGCLFVCIKGTHFDSHDCAAEVAQRGASALVVEREAGTGYAEPSDGRGVTIIRVPDTRYAMAHIAAAWFGHPVQKMKIIGITGTKGKTTTSYLVKFMLENAGYKVGLIGTIETIIGDLHIPAGNTTPESCLLQEYFSRMADEGCQAVVMEVSSQGLKLHRTQGFVFDYGVFTNLEPDHIGAGEHADFAEYMACKSLLFRQCRVGIVNGDDAHWQAVTAGHTCLLERFGLQAGNDLRAGSLRLVKKPGELGIAFSVTGLLSMEAEVAAPGRFSVYNALAAIGVCRHFGVSVRDMGRALPAARVKGRIEMIKVSDAFTVLIDYAHNAMSLQSLLLALREYEPHRLICLFGCGGNRSRLRRFEMGRVSGELADLTIITSDNPRFEEPQAIIEDIKAGIADSKGSYIVISGRREAIAYAIGHGEPDDIIVLAGKGHEDYQEIRGKKYPMDERALIADILRQLPEQHTEERI